MTNQFNQLTHVSTGDCPGCSDCELPENPTEEEMDLANEPAFSWQACQTCGSELGGDRYSIHGVDEDGDIVHMEGCVDCLMKINNLEQETKNG